MEYLLKETEVLQQKYSRLAKTKGGELKEQRIS